MTFLQPVVRTMVLCERVSWDLDEQTYTLSNPLSRVVLEPNQQLPLLFSDLWVYLQLSDALGTSQFQVQVVYDMVRAVVGRSRPFRLSFTLNERLAVRERSVRVPPFPIRRPGLFDVQFLCNDEMLASAPLIVEASA